MIKYMNGFVFFQRYMNGVGFEILARTTVPKLPLLRPPPHPPPPPPPHTHTHESQTSKLSLDERHSFCLECLYVQADLNLHWLQMQSYRKSCASSEISEILLAGFIICISCTRKWIKKKKKKKKKYKRI